MQDWTFTFGIIGLALAIIGTIATILTVPKPATRVPLFILLVLVGLSAIVMIKKGVANDIVVKNSSPTPTPVSTSAATPTPTLAPTPTPPQTPSPQPSATSTEVKTTIDSSTQVLPPQDATRSRRNEPPQAVNNDIGKSKTNDYYEITIENASITTDQIRLDGCHVPVAPGQKALVVRLAIRRLPYKQLTADESFRTGAVKPTDFVIVDPSNRRLDPACQNFSIFVSERPNTKSLVFLVGIDSHRLTLRFQKAATGNITFDLSGLE